LARGRRITRRDLKPANVLLTPGGRPMLFDFNLSSDGQFGGEVRGGTLTYMPPEQLRATAPCAAVGGDAIDARSDLYALGVILYRLLAGRHPFGPLPLDLPPEELRAELLRRQPAGPAPLRTANPDVPVAVARLVERCLASDPAARPAGAAELAAALRRARCPWRRAGGWLAARAGFG